MTNLFKSFWSIIIIEDFLKNKFWPKFDINDIFFWKIGLFLSKLFEFLLTINESLFFIGRPPAKLNMLGGSLIVRFFIFDRMGITFWSLWLLGRFGRVLQQFGDLLGHRLWWDHHLWLCYQQWLSPHLVCCGARQNWFFRDGAVHCLRFLNQGFGC